MGKKLRANVRRNSETADRVRGTCQGVQIDKSKRPRKNIYHPEARMRIKNGAHAPLAFLSIVLRSLASLSRSRRGSIPRSCVAAWFAITESLFLCGSWTVSVAEREKMNV